MSNQNSSEKNMILISDMADNGIIELLKEFKSDVILLPKYHALPRPVSSHADMLFFRYRDRLFGFSEYLRDNIELFKKKKNIIPIRQIPSEKYPNDILLNSVLLREKSDDAFILGAEKFMADELKNLPERKVTVKQGYAHCSSCIVGDSSVITSDRGIAAACAENGCDVLLISPGGIILEGYDTGFIGGASGIAGETFFFFGDPFTHNDGQRMIDFINGQISAGKTSVKNIKYASGPLRDFGGLIYVS